MPRMPNMLARFAREIVENLKNIVLGPDPPPPPSTKGMWVGR